MGDSRRRPRLRLGDFRARLERRETFRDFEYAYADRHGQRHYICVSGEPLLDEDGRFAGYRGMSRDITPRKEAEARIQLPGLARRA